MEAEKINALIIEPGKFPRRIEIANELDELQKAVGGNIEVARYFHEPVGLIVNEEGKIIGLPLNRTIYGDDGEDKDIMAGTFLIVGLTEDDFKSLTEKQMEKYEEKFHHPEAFVMTFGGIRVVQIPDEEVQKRMGKEARTAAPKIKNHEECL